MILTALKVQNALTADLQYSTMRAGVHVNFAIFFICSNVAMVGKVCVDTCGRAFVIFGAVYSVQDLA